MGILQLMSEIHYTKLWDEHLISGTHHLRHLLYSTIVLLADLVRAAVFPSDWFVMRMVTNHTILTAMQEIAQPLISTFLKSGRFDNQVGIFFFFYFPFCIKFIERFVICFSHVLGNSDEDDIHDNDDNDKDIMIFW